jgi:predicted RNase H-like nuclease (RuvC/YqgF family)
VVATNATLAWLGGGSLATGGMGMAGGAAVLGGVVAGPALALMGMAAASRSEKALTEATAREAELRECTEQVNNGHAALVAIATRVNELHKSLNELGKRFDKAFAQLEPIIMGKVTEDEQLESRAQELRSTYEQRHALLRWLDRMLGRTPDFCVDSPLQFDRFSEPEQKRYMQLTELAFALHAVSKVQVLDESGSLLASTQEAIDMAARAIVSTQTT